jgi:hypothetical protein
VPTHRETFIIIIKTKQMEQTNEKVCGIKMPAFITRNDDLIWLENLLCRMDSLLRTFRITGRSQRKEEKRQAAVQQEAVREAETTMRTLAAAMSGCAPFVCNLTGGTWYGGNFYAVQQAEPALVAGNFTVTGGGVNIARTGVYLNGEGGSFNDDERGFGTQWKYLHDASGKIGMLTVATCGDIEVLLGKNILDCRTRNLVDTEGIQNDLNGIATFWAKSENAPQWHGDAQSTIDN